MPLSHCPAVSHTCRPPPAFLLAPLLDELDDFPDDHHAPRWLSEAGSGSAGAGDALEQFKTFLELLDECVICKDLDGVITGWNKGATRLFGFEASEIVGQPITRIIPPELHDEEPAILERIRRGERVEPFQTVRIRKDGSRVDISLSVTPIRNVQGEVVGAVKIARDISFEKKAERQLREQANQLVRLNRSLQKELEQRRKAEGGRSQGASAARSPSPHQEHAGHHSGDRQPDLPLRRRRRAPGVHRPPAGAGPGTWPADGQLGGRRYPHCGGTGDRTVPHHAARAH